MWKMDDADGTLQKFLARKVGEEIDPEVKDLISDCFKRSRFREVKEIRLEEILKEAHCSNLTGYFRSLKEAYESLNPENWRSTARIIKRTADDFLDSTSPNNKSSVIAYILFTDYSIERSEKFEELSRYFQEDLSALKARVSRLEKVASGRRKNIRVKLFSWLPKRVSSLLIEPGKNGKLGKSLRSYLRARDNLVYFTGEAEIAERGVNGCLAERETEKTRGFGLADNLMRKYQQEFHSHNDPYAIRLKIAECRVDYTKRLVDLDNRSTHCSMYIDALVKNSRLIKEPTKRMEMLNLAKPFLENIRQEPHIRFSALMMAYVSLAARTHLEARGEIKWEEIPVFYNSMRRFNEQAGDIIQSSDSESQINLGGAAHTVRHSNEDFSKFLGSIRRNPSFSDCLKPDSNKPLVDFERAYADFLNVAQELIAMKKIPSWDNASYRDNPYSERRK